MKLTKKRIWQIVIGIVIIGLIIIFRKERVIDKKLVKQRVDEIIAYERYQRDLQCKQQALDLAAKVVDSLFEARSINTSFDTTTRPSLPYKPGAPEFKSPLENVPLRPLFDSVAPKK